MNLILLILHWLGKLHQEIERAFAETYCDFDISRKANIEIEKRRFYNKKKAMKDIRSFVRYKYYQTNHRNISKDLELEYSEMLFDDYVRAGKIDGMNNFTGGTNGKLL